MVFEAMARRKGREEVGVDSEGEMGKDGGGYIKEEGESYECVWCEFVSTNCELRSHRFESKRRQGVI